MSRKPEHMADHIKHDLLFRHDLNNHLMAIYNYAEILADDLPPGSKMQRFANNIRISASAIQKMVGEYCPRTPFDMSERERRSASILIVDDHPDIREILAIMLAEEGYDVIVCESPVEAIETVHRNAGKIDILIADYSMPGMNGAEFADRIQCDFPAIPVIIVSGQEQSTLDALLPMPSIKGIVKKPVMPEQLLSAIEKILD